MSHEFIKTKPKDKITGNYLPKFYIAVIIDCQIFLLTKFIPSLDVFHLFGSFYIIQRIPFDKCINLLGKSVIEMLACSFFKILFRLKLALLLDVLVYLIIKIRVRYNAFQMMIKAYLTALKLLV